MKKRILLILTLGVSFTPAVFAGSILGERIAHTGQQRLSETPAVASACNARYVPKGSVSDDSHSDGKASGFSSKSGRAD